MSSITIALMLLISSVLIVGLDSASMLPAANQIQSTNNQIKAKLNSIHMIDKLHHQIRAKEEELRNAENLNKNFEKMIQMVNILGQIDNFLTERTKAVIKKLAMIVDDEEDHINSRED